MRSSLLAQFDGATTKFRNDVIQTMPQQFIAMNIQASNLNSMKV